MRCLCLFNVIIKSLKIKRLSKEDILYNNTYHKNISWITRRHKSTNPPDQSLETTYWLRQCSGSHSRGTNTSLGLESSQSWNTDHIQAWLISSENQLMFCFINEDHFMLAKLFNFAWMFSHVPSLAAVTSLVRRAITRQAASCWYNAWDNSVTNSTNQWVIIQAVDYNDWHNRILLQYNNPALSY